MGPPVQSALHPAAAGAAESAALGLLLYGVLGAVFLLVMVLLVFAIRARARTPTGGHAWLVLGGLVLPVAVLAVLLVESLGVESGAHAEPPAGALRIRVTGHQWWWEVRYEGATGPVVLANEVRLPAGAVAVLELESADVIHSFWVPALAGKVDMVPGRVTHLVVIAPVAGTYRGQCAEFCGLQHAWMAIDAVVEPAADFARWLEGQARPAAAPSAPLAAAGAQEFLRAGCGDCHTIRGTPAAGRVGPDLTHVASRRSLGAGRLANHPANLAGWIAGSQDLKPGNGMPSPAPLDGPALRAVTTYLASLE